MTTTTYGLPALAIRVCHALRDVRLEHEAWVGIERVHDRLGIQTLGTVDAAIAFAAAKGWLKLGGAPTHSVLLNPEAP